MEEAAKELELYQIHVTGLQYGRQEVKKYNNGNYVICHAGDPNRKELRRVSQQARNNQNL